MKLTMVYKDKQGVKWHDCTVYHTPMEVLQAMRFMRLYDGIERANITIIRVK